MGLCGSTQLDPSSVGATIVPAESMEILEDIRVLWRPQKSDVRTVQACLRLFAEGALDEPLAGGLRRASDARRELVSVCRVGGVPPCVRWGVYVSLFRVRECMETYPLLYRRLVTRGPLANGDGGVIDRDLHRTMPHLALFRSDSKFYGDPSTPAPVSAGIHAPRVYGYRVEGQRRLRRILRAYAALDPRVGYCQGMSFVVGALLATGLSEVAAFWVFVGLMQRGALAPLYEGDLLGTRLATKRVESILHERHRKLARKLSRDLGVTVDVTAIQWIMSSFVSSPMPLSSAMCVIDAIVLDATHPDRPVFGGRRPWKGEDPLSVSPEALLPRHLVESAAITADAKKINDNEEHDGAFLSDQRKEQSSEEEVLQRIPPALLRAALTLMLPLEQRIRRCRDMHEAFVLLTDRWGDEARRVIRENDDDNEQNSSNEDMQDDDLNQNNNDEEDFTQATSRQDEENARTPTVEMYTVTTPKVGTAPRTNHITSSTSSPTPTTHMDSLEEDGQGNPLEPFLDLLPQIPRLYSVTRVPITGPSSSSSTSSRGPVPITLPPRFRQKLIAAGAEHTSSARSPVTAPCGGESPLENVPIQDVREWAVCDDAIYREWLLPARIWGSVADIDNPPIPGPISSKHTKITL